MSSPCTPTRQHGPSSTASPSSTSHGSPSSELTPRSKVRALIAAINDNSDVDIEVGKNNSAERGCLIGALDKVSSNSGRIVSSEEDDEMPVVPKGRLAARMLSKKERVVEEEQRGESAYEKVKKQLMQGAKESREGSTGLSKERDDPAEASSEDDGRIVDAVARRREKRTLGRTSRQGTPMSPRLRLPRSSPGLFLSSGLGSPRQEADAVATGSNGSDSDLPARPTENSRFLALVARKREERLAKEEAESRKKAEREAQMKALSKKKHRARDSNPIVGSEDDSDGNDGGRQLTQQACPTRKASKKALEEMNRETQRMSRNMQLAHQARTKKKITKESFFAKFNFKPLGCVPADTDKAASSSTAASSAAVSDTEGLQLRETPPTSPIHDNASMEKVGAEDGAPMPVSLESHEETCIAVDEELPTMGELMAQPIHRLDKGKGKVAEPTTTEKSPTSGKDKKLRFTQGPIKVHPPTRLAQFGNKMVDSDSDLEIVAEPAVKPKKTNIFDRLPAEKPTEDRSLLTLRALANLASPGKQNNKQNSKTKVSMNPTELQACLRKRARQQAAHERAEKLQQLRDKGIIVQTTEERQRDQAEVEDLVEKARKEADEIMKKEKDAAKNDGKKSGKTDVLDDTSDEDDEEYVDDAEEGQIELSGSEEEGGSNIDEEEADGGEDVQNDEEDLPAMKNDSENIGGLIDREASEDVEDDEQGDDEASEDDEHQSLAIHNRRKTKYARVISDDDENGDDAIPARQSPEASVSAQNPFIPGLPTSAGIPLGLTQAFAATMADSQSQVDDTVMADVLDQEQNSLAFLRGMPEPDFPVFDTTMAQDSEDLVRDSQLSQTESRVEESQEVGVRPDIDLHYSQSQIRYDTMVDTQRMPTATQYSELPDPTQDVGFAISSPPAGRSYDAPPSTVDTILLPEVQKEISPVIKKKGRLRRRVEAISILADAEQDTVARQTEGDFVISPNVFDVMRQAAKKPAPIVNDFDKKKSEAKAMVEEQAEESEDEYAGLGGASDDESGGSEDEEMKKLIDESDVKVDERKLAAFYADKERASDAKAVEKLFKDMNSGLLRRKRGADIDLSDDSDDADARRRRKQREFAKMRKALLADENIGKIADNPKTLAFLRAIEDREKIDDDEEDGLHFLDRADDHATLESQVGGGDDSQSLAPAPPLKRKRPLEDSNPDTANRRPPPHLRRVNNFKKPATLAEIRESVSFLLEEPHADAPVALGLESSDVEDDDNKNSNNDADDDDHNPRRQAPNSPTRPRRRATNPIIDRIALKRASSATAASNPVGSKLAFYDPSAAFALPSAFRIPSLSRRATTQLTAAEANHGVTERRATEVAGSVILGMGMKMGGSKKSSINYFARETERRALVEGRVREREVGRLRGAVRERERRGVVGGVFGGGRFE